MRMCACACAQGPYPVHRIAEMLSAKQLKPSTQVWTLGMPAFVTLAVRMPFAARTGGTHTKL